MDRNEFFEKYTSIFENSEAYKNNIQHLEISEIKLLRMYYFKFPMKSLVGFRISSTSPRFEPNFLVVDDGQEDEYYEPTDEGYEKAYKYFTLVLNNAIKNDALLVKIDSNLKEIKRLNEENNKEMTQELEEENDIYISELVNCEDGINAYDCCWLGSLDTCHRFNAAMNLYPLFPKLCMSILVRLEKNETNEVVQSSIKTVINAYNKGLDDDNPYINRLKKIYKTNDLHPLSKNRKYE